MTESGTDPVVRPTPRSVAAPGDWSSEHPLNEAPRRNRGPVAVVGRSRAGGAGAVGLLVLLLAVLRRRRRRAGRLARLSR